MSYSFILAHMQGGGCPKGGGETNPNTSNVPRHTKRRIGSEPNYSQSRKEEEDKRIR